MTFILNAWYVAALPEEVPAGGMLARTICGLALVLFRDRDGTVSCLEDRCCHRELPLSMGAVEDGRIRCGYHGLLFDGTGACVEIPGDPRKIPPTLAVPRYPSISRYGWIWVWPGDPALADPDEVPNFFIRNAHPDWASGGGVTHVRCNYQLISDNLLDPTHAGYVHKTSLGADAIVRVPMSLKVEADAITVGRQLDGIDPGPFWGNALRDATGYEGPCDRWQIVNWRPPANLVLDVGVTPAGEDRDSGVPGCNLNAITPETESSTWYFWAFARRFKQEDAALTAHFTEQVGTIFQEDKKVMEAVQQVMDRHPGRRFVSIRTDGGGVAARAEIKRRIAAERKVASERGKGQAEARRREERRAVGQSGREME